MGRLLLVLFFAIPAFAQSVSVNVDGKIYTCTPGGGGQAADPQCVKDLQAYCYSKTSYNSTQCYDKASVACKGAPANYVTCVREATDFCYSSTSLNASQCFERALSSCGGGTDGMVGFLKSMRDSKK